MKRIYLFTILMVSAVLMTAQNAMQISIPKLEHLATLVTDGVNIRKAASATSPRLMELTTEENFQEFHLVWEGSADAKRRGYSCQAFHMGKGETLIILDEQGEWYKVLISYGDKSYCDDYAVGYIMKKFLNPIDTPLPTLTQNMLVGSLRTSGKYKGCSVEAEIGMDVSRMTMGKIINGNMFVKFCFAEETYFSLEENQQKPLIIEKDEYSQTLKYNKSFSTRVRIYYQHKQTHGCRYYGYFC